MTLDFLDVDSHVIPASFIRGSHRGSKQNGGLMKLSVNQYKPKLPSSDPESFTIIAAHGIGTCKEAFEPFFDDLIRAGVPVRNIWIADAAHNCASYELNNKIYGDEVHWLDYTRDIFQMINHFQQQIQPPLIGIGHSLGVGNLAVLARWHPRLFSGIVSLEPGLGPYGNTYPAPPRFFPGVVAMRRTEIWPSLSRAAEDLRKSRAYKAYDPRVFERVLKYELRGLRSDERPDDSSFSDGVTLRTPKRIEVASWFIPEPPLAGYKEPIEHNAPGKIVGIIPGARRPEAIEIHDALPHLLAPVLYVWGTKSPLTPEWKRKALLNKTGHGVGGNGGTESGAVTACEVDSGHMMPQEQPDESARAVARWLKLLNEKLIEESKGRKTQEPPFIYDVQPELLERFSKL